MSNRRKVFIALLVGIVLFIATGLIIANRVFYSMYAEEREKLFEGLKSPSMYYPKDATEDNNSYDLMTKAYGIIKFAGYDLGYFYQDIIDNVVMSRSKKDFDVSKCLRDDSKGVILLDSIEYVMELIRQIAEMKYCFSFKQIGDGDAYDCRISYKPDVKIAGVVRYLETRAVIAARRGQIEKMYESLELANKIRMLYFTRPYGYTEIECFEWSLRDQLYAYLSCAILLGDKFEPVQFERFMTPIAFDEQRGIELSQKRLDTERIVAKKGSAFRPLLNLVFPSLEYYAKAEACRIANESREYYSLDFVELHKLFYEKSGYADYREPADDKAIGTAYIAQLEERSLLALEQGQKITIAVMSYYRERGSFPEAMADLSNFLSKRNMVSMFTGEPLVMIKKENHLVVWGIPVKYVNTRVSGKYLDFGRVLDEDGNLLAEPELGNNYMEIYEPAHNPYVSGK